MAFSHGTPNSIVTDGLIFCVDPANVLSYPGSGTTVTDLIGDNNSTLTGDGITFENTNAGIFDLDGSDDYIDVNSANGNAILMPTNDTLSYTGGNVTLAISARTYSCWFRVDTTGLKTIFAASPRGGGWHAKLDINSDDLVEYALRTPSPSYTTTTGTTTISINTWYNVTVTIDGSDNKVFLNGIEEGSTSCSGNMIFFSGNTSPNPRSFVGAFYTTSPTQEFNGKISNITIYNKALSAVEVLQNYNALKNRFRT